MHHHAARSTELVLLLLLATLWGASYSFIRIAVETLPPLTLMACRTVIAAGLLLVFLSWRGHRLPRTRSTWRQFAVQALLNSVVPFTLLAWAQQEVEAGLATILNVQARPSTAATSVTCTRQRRRPVPCCAAQRCWCP
jgi:drug/metabolite transporter (DMT)-like permease